MFFHIDEIQMERVDGGHQVFDCDGERLFFVPVSMARTPEDVMKIARWASPVLNRVFYLGEKVGERNAKLAMRKALEL